MTEASQGQGQRQRHGDPNPASLMSVSLQESAPLAAAMASSNMFRPPLTTIVSSRAMRDSHTSAGASGPGREDPSESSLGCDLFDSDSVSSSHSRSGRKKKSKKKKKHQVADAEEDYTDNNDLTEASYSQDVRRRMLQLKQVEEAHNEGEDYTNGGEDDAASFYSNQNKSTSTGSSTTPKDLDRQAKTQLDARFQVTATRIQDAVQTRMEVLQEALQAQATAITNLAYATKTTWPYYVPNPANSFQQGAQHILNENRLSVLGLAPVIANDKSQLNMWNRFVTFKTNGTVPHAVYAFQQATSKSYTYNNNTHNVVMDTNHSLVAPIWLLSPPPKDTGIINYDVLANQAVYDLFQEMQNLSTTDENTDDSDSHLILSHILDLAHVSRGVHGDQSETSTSTSTNHNHPHSLLLQPIFYDNAQYSSNPENNENQAQPVALLFGIFYWHELFSDLQIPTTSSTTSRMPVTTKSGANDYYYDDDMSIVCQIRNSCGQSLSYQLAAPNNDNKYNGTMYVRVEQPDSQKDNANANANAMEVPLHIPGNDRNNQACSYTLSIQPEYVQEQQQDHQQDLDTNGTAKGNDKTALYTSLMALLFIAGGAVIWATISAIQQRQEEQLTKAKSQIGNNNDLLATLFPSTYYMGMQQWFGANTTYDYTNQKTGKEDYSDKKSKQNDGGASTTSSKKKKNRGKPTDDDGGGTQGEGEGMDYSYKQDYRIATMKDESHHSRVASRNSLGTRGSQHSRFTNRRGSGGTLTSAGKGSIGRGSEHSNISRIRAKKAQMIESTFTSRPIADLFPDATVMYADICGFAAWSSSREPHHIFELLESIYHTLDQIARRKNVFKVETVGDCYVAVTGIPVPTEDHAVVLCSFARDCLMAMDQVTKTLEVALGPDTGELALRIGISSGPVTAGIMRGDRPRFQLFGETCIRAARIEEEGERGRILISKATADLLTAAGKSSWFFNHDQKVILAGRGHVELHTYWLDPRHGSEEVKHDNSRDMLHPQLLKATQLIKQMDKTRLITAKHQRLIDWIVDQMQTMLKQVVVHRNHMEGGVVSYDPMHREVITGATVAQSEVCYFEHVKEVIEMPTFDSAAAQKVKQADDIELSPDVMWQLHDFATSISTMYRDNPFHNFEHASHVTMSVIKVLSRVVCPTEYNTQTFEQGRASSLRASTKNRSELHDFSYGISSDPLSQFAVVFGALIHDVDHLGVSNVQLVKEGSRLARIYKSTSVAEQNSLNIAWDLLFDPAFEALRCCIFTNESEFIRFRSTVVNVVMATDIVDKDLKALRNARWEKAFSKKEAGEKMTKEDSDRMATLVLEHLIQASDISHTMQHWHIYQKWNHRLFRELYIAHKTGRMDANPADFWYKGEIGFFDFYIIPLAKKLQECGVFGVSCDEFLNYACANRDQWEKEGEDVVKYLVQSVEKDVEIQRIVQKYQKGQEKGDSSENNIPEDAKETDVAAQNKDELNASTKGSNHSSGACKKEQKEFSATSTD